MLFHKLYRNKFKLITPLQNKIIDSGKEKMIRNLMKYLTILLATIILIISKGYTIYTIVILGIVAGFVSPIIYNDKEERLYKQIYFHKGWIMRRK